MPDIVLESPLVNVQRLGKRALHVDGQTCWLDEIPFLGLLNLRGTSTNAAFAQAVQAATGLALPTTPNTVSTNATAVGDATPMASRQLLWLGPDEWLYKCNDTSEGAVETALRSALAGQHFAVTPVGSGFTTLTLEGIAAPHLLARGCPLDLHPRVFGTGAMAQSHIAKANVVLYCTQAGRRYELTVRRSFADYLFQWLCAASD